MAAIYEPELRVYRSDEAPQDKGQQDKEQKKAPSLEPGTGEVAREALPFALEVDRFALHQGVVSFATAEHPGRALLRIHDLEAVIENYSTDRASSGGLPTLVVARGRIGREGHIELFATINPWSGQLDFVGRAQVVSLHLDEVSGLVEERVDLEPRSGTISVFMEFSVQDGQIIGAIKPFITGLSVDPAKPGLANALKAWVASAAIELLSTHRERGQGLATTIPIRGSLVHPDAHLLEALIGLLGNAFIEALAVSYGAAPLAER